MRTKADPRHSTPFWKRSVPACRAKILKNNQRQTAKNNVQQPWIQPSKRFFFISAAIRAASASLNASRFPASCSCGNERAFS